MESLLSDYGIEVATQSDKHYREGWVNVSCPFCTGNPGYHLGYNKDDKYFYCWRCGWHSIYKVLVALLGISYNDVKALLSEYNLNIVYKQRKKKSGSITLKNCEKPAERLILPNLYKKYLNSLDDAPTTLQFNLLQKRINSNSFLVFVFL